ncbi:MAG TPA: transglycosylase domain-containing protein [Patescibacteria group bacterium]|nr:transglycosylase domain-containing protein [Patescibacteria group bacterium]
MRNLFGWPGLVLENIGRATYKSIFWVIVAFFKAFQASLKQLQSITVKAPRVRLPKVKLPKIKRLRLKIARPELKPWQYFVLAVVAASALLFYWAILKDLPHPSDLTSRQPTLSTKIYDRNGTLLFTFYKDQNRTLISLKEVPDYFVKATLAIEDSQFYRHNGISWKGILRSLNQIIFKQNLQGGSTITQQLVKSALLTPDRTLVRKIKELVLAVEVELLYSKDQILEMYLNQVSYGGTAYGTEQAAQTYFGKSIKEVNLAEAALLAGLPASPTTYSPFGANPYLSVYRQHQVLNLMVQNQFIAPQEASLAKQQKITLAPQYQNIKAPHFVMYVKDLLVTALSESMVDQGGLSVTTSLDWDLQLKVQEIVTSEVNQLYSLRITNGAALVTNPQTGEILAMVGSRDYFDTENDGQVNVTTRLRQPGSSIKPVNYAYALEHGFTAASLIQDSPVTYDLAGSKPYSPVNYDGKWHGPVTLRTALANSYNVPAVKVLASYGVNKMIAQGEKMGITTWNQPERYGLSLTLGGAEVKMTDMAVVFGTLATGGKKVNLRPILEVKNATGKILPGFDCGFDCQPEQVLNPSTAYILTDILSDPIARSAAFGSRSYLNIPESQVAVKTGTTNDKRDNWTIGYTTDRLTAVWVGNNDNSPMSQVASGITGASPIWNKIMQVLLKNAPPHHFANVAGLIKVNVCTLTGQLSCSSCPTKTEYFTPGTEPKTACSPEQIQQLLEEKAKKDQEGRDQILTGVSI